MWYVDCSLYRQSSIDCLEEKKAGRLHKFWGDDTKLDNKTCLTCFKPPKTYNQEEMRPDRHDVPSLFDKIKKFSMSPMHAKTGCMGILWNAAASRINSITGESQDVIKHRFQQRLVVNLSILKSRTWLFKQHKIKLTEIFLLCGGRRGY